MEIIINNKKETVPDRETLQSLLEKLKMYDTTGMAVAVNNQVINRSQWDKTSLHPNDDILVIKASQGG